VVFVIAMNARGPFVASQFHAPDRPVPCEGRTSERTVTGSSTGSSGPPERVSGSSSSVVGGSDRASDHRAAPSTGGEPSAERVPKRARLGSPSDQAATAAALFGSEDSSLYLGAMTATATWRIEHFPAQRQRAEGACLDGPKFGPREPWQIFCHPDGRCFNQPQGGPPGVFLRYLGPHERVPAYATIEMFSEGEFRVPENNARDAPFVVLFGRSEIEEWGVCKDFGLFDDAFGRSLVDDCLVLRARVAWIEPRPDSLLPHEVVSVRGNALSFAGEGSLQADLGNLWNARRPPGAGPSGGPACSASRAAGVPADLVLVCEQQRFDADRAVLAARSSFFGALLSKQYRESEQREVELQDYSARALAATLRFIYTDEAPEMRTRDEAEEFLTAASKFGVPGMLRACSDCLRDRWLRVESAVGLLRLADEHGATSLRSDALAVLGANFDQVKRTAEWLELLRSGMNPTLIEDMVQAVADASIFAGRASIKL